MFEYRNEFFALRTPAEIRGWIADRKKWYPTAARLAEKQAEQKALQEKKARENELNRKVQKGQEAEKTKQSSNKKSRPEKRKRRETKLQRQLRKAERLRKRIGNDETVAGHADTTPRADTKPGEIGIQNNEQDESMGRHPDQDPRAEVKADDGAVALNTDTLPSIKSSPNTLSPEVSMKVNNEEVPENKSDVSSVSAESSGDSGDESHVSRDGTSSDDGLSNEEAPVEQSSKIAKEVNKLPQHKIANTKFRLPCKYFIRDGSCKRNDCRFAHEVDSGRQLTLFERVSHLF
jgi:hypothetical protein